MQEELETLLRHLTRYPDDTAARAAITDYVLERNPFFDVNSNLPGFWVRNFAQRQPVWQRGEFPASFDSRPGVPEVRQFAVVLRAACIRYERIEGGHLLVGTTGYESAVCYAAAASAVWVLTPEPERVLDLTWWLHLPALVMSDRLVWIEPAYPEPAWLAGHRQARRPTSPTPRPFASRLATG
jgi:hypothetical protein